MRNSYLEVNLNNFSENLKIIRDMIGPDVSMAPVIKADGYGIGAKQLMSSLTKNDIDKVVVATTDEAKELRENGFTMEIITLNELMEDEAEDIVRLDLTPAVSNIEVVKSINENAKKADKIIKVHIEVDTGMGRVGLKPNQMVEFANEISKLSNIKIEGLFTHFSSADSSEEYTNNQVKIFNKVYDELKLAGYSFKYVHASASSGILFFENARFTMTRPGIIMYGYMPDKTINNKWGFKPTTKLVSHIAFIKDVKNGTPIGYSRTYTTNGDKVVATIPMGYADGIRRALSNKGRVYVNGKYAPIIGNVCMDNFMIDVTGIDVKVGDEVFIWDNDNISLEEVADNCNTINYEIMCGISKRVMRKYIG